jgi:hypothetical protein
LFHPWGLKERPSLIQVFAQSHPSPTTPSNPFNSRETVAVPVSPDPSIPNELDKLYDLVQHEYQVANIFAIIFQILSYFVAGTIIVGGATAALLAKSSYPWRDTAILVLGIVIAGCKSFTSAVNLDQQSLTYKQISIKLRDLEFTVLQANSPTDPNLTAKLTSLYQQFDDLDISLFSQSMLGKMSPTGSAHFQKIKFFRRQTTS